MDAIKADGGKAAWALKVTDVFIGADSAATDAMVELLLRDHKDEDSSRYVRINPKVAAGEFKLDRLSESLIALGGRTSEHASRNLRRRFFSQKAEPFTPAPLPQTSQSPA